MAEEKKDGTGTECPECGSKNLIRTVRFIHKDRFQMGQADPAQSYVDGQVEEVKCRACGHEFGTGHSS